MCSSLRCHQGVGQLKGNARVHVTRPLGSSWQHITKYPTPGTEVFVQHPTAFRNSTILILISRWFFSAHGSVYVQGPICSYFSSKSCVLYHRKQLFRSLHSYLNEPLSFVFPLNRKPTLLSLLCLMKTFSFSKTYLKCHLFKESFSDYAMIPLIYRYCVGAINMDISLLYCHYLFLCLP